MQPWDVVKVWKRIPPSTFTGILSTIKSNLLTFLLELKEELGDENIPLMSKKKEIDKLFDKNINNITATTVYIANGDKSIQSTTTDNAKTEIVQKNIEGNYSDDALKNDLKDLLAIFRKLEQETELEDADEINGELSRIEIQTKKEQPKRKIIKQSLETLKSVAINIASNGISTPVLGKIGEIISFLG